MIDIVIVGGGIAGLWTLARLKKLGYQAILLESDTLGSGQTGASQGIIHGGTKYALTGKLTHSSQAIGAMPELWRGCLAGTGELDLSQVKTLSQHQFLWANKSIGAQLAGFFAGKVMQSRMQALKKQNYPDFFSSPNFQGKVYQLDEPVLDSFSLVEELARQNQQAIFSMRIERIEKRADSSYRLLGNKQVIDAKTLIFCAGNGNKHLLNIASQSEPQMQQRPLYQPMLRGKLPLLYAHCLGTSALPRLTISAHKMENDVVWYLGGEIAEKGINRTQNEQVVAAQQELKSWIPWHSFDNCAWAAHYVNRAEPKMNNRQRPVDPFVSERQNIITAWPVKLAMTPIMVDMVIKNITKLRIKPNNKQVSLSNLESVPIAKAPWQIVPSWQQ